MWSKIQDGGNWTHNLWCPRPMLYQLSYILFFFRSRGIRTHGLFLKTSIFKIDTISHSDILPYNFEYVGNWTQNLWFTRPLLYQLSYIFWILLSLKGFEPLTTCLSNMHSTNWVISSKNCIFMKEMGFEPMNKIIVILLAKEHFKPLSHSLKINSFVSYETWTHIFAVKGPYPTN